MRLLSEKETRIIWRDETRRDAKNKYIIITHIIVDETRQGTNKTNIGLA